MRLPACAWTVLFCAGCILAATDAPAPPTIAQGGVINAASHMPMASPGGAIARGSLFHITGWRLGPAPPAPLSGVQVQIRRDDETESALVQSASEQAIDAIMPDSAPLGRVEVRVIRDGLASESASVNVVAHSFGIFSRNDRGWGPGDIHNADGSPNTAAHSARPGETLVLRGTGIGPSGVAGLQLIAGGMAINTLRQIGNGQEHGGIESIAFTLPKRVPQGCSVPIQVIEGDTVSNTVTVSINRKGGPCKQPLDWNSSSEKNGGPIARFILVRSEVQLLFGLQPTVFRMDAGYAAFSTQAAVEDQSPFTMLPAIGTCATYNGSYNFRDLLSIFAAFGAHDGIALDAGAQMHLSGPSREKDLPKNRDGRSYGGFLGGNSPLPWVRPQPPFFEPGEYRLSAPGGKDVPAFESRVRVTPPLLWTNEDESAAVNRSQGLHVSWHAGRKDALIAILTLNIGTASTLGLCSCLVPAKLGAFDVRSAFLRNIPESSANQPLPTSLVILAEMPAQTGQKISTPGLGGVNAVYLSVVGRSVQIR